ncbi:MAG: NUDIX domain-containing protein [Deltaproteobacteria bacterium]|nr:MAG: NUDIX domain-containing protein [Deltaproteobacteria bacterium]
MTGPLRVVAGAIIVGGRVLAARRPPGGPRGGLWELPGGKVEAGESDAAALARELAEELGVTVAVGERLASHLHRYPDGAIHLSAMRCELVAGRPEPREHAALRWLDSRTLDEVEWAAADMPLLEAVRPLLR